MKFDPDIHHRRSIRLQGYDYSQAGAYFVTICTNNRQCRFGEIVNGEMRLNEPGEIVADEWRKTATICDEVDLDEWVVMPNHFHGILVLTGSVGAIPVGVIPVGAIPVGAIHESPRQMTMAQRRRMALPKLIGRFKILSAKRINEWHKTPGDKLWQRNCWEHIVRTEEELNRIREYI